MSGSTCGSIDARRVKQLLPELSGHRDIVERFFNEAKAAASINHPGIVEIYDVGWHTDGSAYFAMKLLDGDSLAKRIRAGGPMPVPRAVTIARQVATALVAAHKAGIVHRDLKPDNIMLVPDEEVMIGERATVLDFGIAKLFGDKPLSQKTRTGMMMGTPLYMSPEQCRGAGEVDHRTDVYALGCILFEMLTGRAPFVGEGAGEILGMHQFVEPPAIATLRDGLPPDLAALIMRTLAKKPEQRQQQMSELAAALQPYTGGTPSAQQSAQLPVASQALPNQATAFTPPPRHASEPAPVPSTMSSAPGEISALAPKKKSKAPLVIGGGVLAAVGVIAIVAASSSGSNTTTPDASQIAAPPTPDAAQRIEPDAATVKPELKVLLDKARRELADRKWEDAIATAAQVSLGDPSNAEAKEIGRRAFTESKAEVADRTLADAIKRNDAPAVKAAFATVPDSSVYRPEAKTRYDAYVTAFVAAGKKQAQTLAAQHRCDELAKLGPSLAKTFPEAEKVTAGIACTRGGASIGGEEGVKEEPSLVAKPPKGDATALIDEARRAAMAGQYALAAKKAEDALRLDPNNQEALTPLMLGACNARNAPMAKRYFPRVVGARRSAIRQVCLRNNIDLGE